MYEVKGKHWIHRGDGLVPPAEPVRFRTAMGMLRWALDSGAIHRRGAWGNTVPGPGEMERVSIPYAGSGDWESGFAWYFTPDQVEAMGVALSRYRAILRYLREVEPEWTETGRTHYADNSTEVDETDKYGRTRRRMITCPYGDACF